MHCVIIKKFSQYELDGQKDAEFIQEKRISHIHTGAPNVQYSIWEIRFSEELLLVLQFITNTI
jgi:hypothetical protein